MISKWICKHCGEVRHGNKRWACFKLATDGHYGGDCEPLIDATTIRSTPPPPQWNLMELPSFSRDPKITDKVVLTVHNENEATAKIYRHDGVIWTEKLTRYWEPQKFAESEIARHVLPTRIPVMVAELVKAIHEYVDEIAAQLHEDKIDAERHRVALSCVRVGPHGEYVIIPGDNHDFPIPKVAYEESLDTIIQQKEKK